jgi:hypothetical protein
LKIQGGNGVDAWPERRESHSGTGGIDALFDAVPAAFEACGAGLGERSLLLLRGPLLLLLSLLRWRLRRIDP